MKTKSETCRTDGLKVYTSLKKNASKDMYIKGWSLDLSKTFTKRRVQDFLTEDGCFIKLLQ